MEEFMEEFVVLSKVRTGHKREFAFALRSQYEIACSLGSRRTRKPVIGFNRVQSSPIQNRKRMKKSGKRLGVGKRKNGKGSGAEGKRRRNGGLMIGQQQRSGSYGEAYDNAVASYSDFETGERTEDDDSMEKLRKVRRKCIVDNSYHHIYTSEGKSLLSLARSLPGKQKNLVEEKDELCNVCRLDGYFISCHGCPRVFHKECVHLQEIPDGQWYCRVCRYQRNNVAGTSRNDTAAGVAGKERQSMQLVETEESVRGGCVLCRAYDFSKEGFGSRTILLCDQCEREYHVGCLKEHGIQDLEEQFSPIVLPGSKTDLIPYMVFGKNMKKDKDYRGVYCAVLTVK